MTNTLQDYGLVPSFVQQLSVDEIENGLVARIIEVQRSQLTIFDGSEEKTIPLNTVWRESSAEERPTVGDWVVLNHSLTAVERVLERKSLIKRIAAGESVEFQLIAANIDILFIVTSCNEEFNESRLERYLAVAEQAGVIPVIVLTKIDLAKDSDSFVNRVRQVHAEVPVESINALDETTFAGVKAWIKNGTTIALVGSSGVGKSTLLNSLAGSDIAATRTIREDDKKGRHTTTHRALFRLASGGLVIDVPGIRELKVAGLDEALPNVFSDIQALSAKCRFKDCQHESEPGCAIRDAVSSGELDERRLRNYQKLLRENERNNSSLAERRSQGRAFAKLVKEVKALKHERRGDT